MPFAEWHLAWTALFWQYILSYYFKVCFAFGDIKINL